MNMFIQGGHIISFVRIRKVSISGHVYRREVPLEDIHCIHIREVPISGSVHRREVLLEDMFI